MSASRFLLVSALLFQAASLPAQDIVQSFSPRHLQAAREERARLQQEVDEREQALGIARQYEIACRVMEIDHESLDALIPHLTWENRQLQELREMLSGVRPLTTIPFTSFQLLDEQLSGSPKMTLVLDRHFMTAASCESTLLDAEVHPIVTATKTSKKVDWRHEGISLDSQVTPLGGNRVHLKSLLEITHFDHDKGIKVSGQMIPAISSESAMFNLKMKLGETALQCRRVQSGKKQMVRFIAVTPSSRLLADLDSSSLPDDFVSQEMADLDVARKQLDSVRQRVQELETQLQSAPMYQLNIQLTKVALSKLGQNDRSTDRLRFAVLAQTPITELTEILQTETPRPEVYRKQLESMLLNRTPHSAMRLLADPTLAITAEEPAACISGGDITYEEQSAGQPPHEMHRPCGISVILTLSTTSEGRVRLEGSIENSIRNEKTNGLFKKQQIPSITTFRNSSTFDLTPGKTHVISIDAKGQGSDATAIITTVTCKQINPR